MHQSAATRFVMKSFPLVYLAAVACSRVQSTAIAEPVGPRATPGPSNDLALPHIVGLGGGPQPLVELSAAEGQLIVHTDVSTDPAVEVQHQDGRRLPYTILDGYLRILRAIQTDTEAPAVVALQPGDYLVRAETLGGGTVDVKVHILGGQTTEVILDGSVARVGRDAGGGVVRDPDGRFVGWRANATR